jgi:hypothetical protein
MAAAALLRMDSRGIISSIHEIYARYNIPPTLQEHMLRATAVGELICDHWNGQGINKSDIVAVLLIHDLGNIVKMDMSSERGRTLMGTQAQRFSHWHDIQQKMIERYGKDDHVANERIAEEIGAHERLRFLVANKIFVRSDNVLASDDWELKIALYADFRVGPEGILSLAERFEEGRRRYAGRGGSFYHPRVEEFLQSVVEIEREVMAQTDIRAEDISDDSVQQYVQRRKAA